MDDVIGVFHDHGGKKSNLVYWSEEKDITPNGPKSIVKLCEEHKFKQCVAVSDNFSTFIEAYKAFDKVGIQFVFGLDLWMVADVASKDDFARKQESKITIFIKNSQGYQDLIKLYTDCYTNKDRAIKDHRLGTRFRYDWKALKGMWTDNLSLALPFFDSAIAKNCTVWGAQIMPEYPVDPVIFREVKSEHPMEETINAALDEYNRDSRFAEQKVKNIYYAKREDFKANAVYRSIHHHSSYSKPEMEYFCSPEFCLESYLEVIK